MNNKEFKKIFSDMAKKNSFVSEFGGWFKESNECILILDLQKSNFGNFYYLNIKIFVHGAFGEKYTKSKDLVKWRMGAFFLREPSEYSPLFDLENKMEDELRKNKLKDLFV